MEDRQDRLSITPRKAQDDVLKPGDGLLRGQYRIERYLSSGGFGVTYLATDSLDRTVVIKECYPNAMCCRAGQTVQVRSQSMKEDFAAVVRHFGYEAQRLAKLSHPNIVGVHQVFEDMGTAYMALDYIEGRDLMDIIEQDRESLSAEQIKTLLIKLLDAVAYIHDNDVLHRDISPDNILIDNTGNPVLIDFGAAREVATNATRALSALHVVKDGYSPQEFYLADGSQEVSSDLYSLAASFYHLITGTPPTNSQVRLAALAEGMPDPFKPIPPCNSEYDHFFLEAFDKALQVFPKHRLKSATEWLALIDKKRRQKALEERAAKDQKMDLAIKLLTEETNKAIAKTTESERKAEARTKSPPSARDARAAKASAQQPARRAAAQARRQVAGQRVNSAQIAKDTRNQAVPKRRRLLSPGALLAHVASRLGFARNKSDQSERGSS